MEVPCLEDSHVFSIDEGRWTSDPNTNNTRINLNFEYKSVIKLWDLDCELKKTTTSIMKNSLSIIQPEEIDSGSTYEMITSELCLRLCNVREDFLENMVHETINKTLDMLTLSISGKYNVLDVYVKYSKRQDHFEYIQQDYLESLSEGEEDSGHFEDILQEESEFSEGEEDPEEMQEESEFSEGEEDPEEIQEPVEDSSGNMMVPAMESSIKSLKRKRITMDCDGTCPICFEDLFSSGNNEEEAVCMPCSHEFHADCITDWLRISHYCPMCRYEMPTEKLPKYQ